MLSVAVHKDVGEYQPKIIGKLTLRTLICITCALGFSILSACYLHFILGVDVANNSWIVYVVSLPFWLCGFWKPHGMKFEEFLPAWLRHQLSENRIMYIPTPVKLGFVARMKGESYDKSYKKFIKIKGREAYSPRAGAVEGYCE